MLHTNFLFNLKLKTHTDYFFKITKAESNLINRLAKKENKEYYEIYYNLEKQANQLKFNGKNLELYLMYYEDNFENNQTLTNRQLNDLDLIEPTKEQIRLNKEIANDIFGEKKQHNLIESAIEKYIDISDALKNIELLEKQKQDIQSKLNEYKKNGDLK